VRAGEPCESGDVPPRPSAPRHSGTQTFAARDALLEWTARIESTAPRAPAEELGGGAGTESGMTAPNPAHLSEPARARRLRQRAFAVVLGSCALLAVAVLGHRLLLGSGATAAPVAPSAAAATAPTAAPGSGVELASAPALAVAPAVAPAPEAAAASATSAARSSAPALPPPPVAPARDELLRAQRAREAPVRAAASEVARLQLTADPAAWVELDAARIGRTPLMNHGTSAGRHTVTFINQLLGEKLQTTVTLSPAGVTRVHADFTSANPRVYVR
jgi:hypothetical protein